MIAGGQIRPMQGDRAIQQELENTLTHRLLQALERKAVRGKRLV
jgi:hypothetical protein